MVQRWAASESALGLVADPDGDMVLYADHVAALAEVERRTREDDNRALWDNRARAEALREAREAVAALAPHLNYQTASGDYASARVDISVALAAIDALKGEAHD